MTVWGSDPSRDMSLHLSSFRRILPLQTELGTRARTPGPLPDTRLLGDPLPVPRLQEGQCSSASLEGTVSLHPEGPRQRAVASQLRQKLVLLLVLGGRKEKVH